jgi:hypothetical protein
VIRRSQNREVPLALLFRSCGALNMSQVSTGILAGTAIALTLSAVQLASGRDLYSALQSRPAAQLDASINRSAKADRSPRLPAEATRTISLRLDALSDTSILVRIPIAQQIPNMPMVPRASSGSPMVACEAVVSVLSEVANQLQPGRCLS